MQAEIGIIGGTSLRFSNLDDMEKQLVMTPFGSAEIHRKDIIVLIRYQDGLPPHRINFRAKLSF
jgi:5'-methylthioadenosine phosphorylase